MTTACLPDRFRDLGRLDAGSFGEVFLAFGDAELRALGIVAPERYVRVVAVPVDR